MVVKISKLIKKQSLTKNIFSFLLECEEISKLANPGQFINILVGNLPLRRPISVCEIDKNLIRIVFKVRGKGTAIMSKWQEGENINIMGPLGHGFSKTSSQDRLLLIGGGVGLAPLLQLAKTAEYVHTLAGFNTKEEIILKDDFEKYGEMTVATNDGSFSKKGIVTEFISPIIENDAITRIAACGPEQMLDAVATIAKKNKVFCEISVEERMGCGIGACLCCHKIINKKAVHVCKDGPVFIV